jgi:anti-sigma factor RsiW
MTSCANDTLRDLLPDRAAGRLAPADRAAVDAHLTSCASCRAELALLGAARRALPAPPPMNVGRIVAALPAPPAAAARGPADATAAVIPLDAHRRGRLSRPFALGTALAAAAAVAGLMITPAARQTVDPAAPAPVAASAAPEGRGASPATDDAAAVAGSVQLASLDVSTLTATEYDALMDELEATSEILAPVVEPPADSTFGGV